MNDSGTCRCYRPDPVQLEAVEQWGRGQARADFAAETVVLTVRGEIDAVNGAQLADYVERHAALAPSLIVDTRGIDFFGTAGLTALRRIDFRLGANGVRWSLVAGAAVRKVLRVCGADDLPQTSGASRVLAQSEPTSGARQSASV